jgi:hypothetical protein
MKIQQAIAQAVIEQPDQDLKIIKNIVVKHTNTANSGLNPEESQTD